MITSASIVRVVDSLFGLYGLLILAYVILSWFRGNESVREVYGALETVCEPFVGIFRRFLPVVPMGGGALDLSPLVALFALQLIRSAFVTILRSLL